MASVYFTSKGFATLHATHAIYFLVLSLLYNLLQISDHVYI